MSFDDVVKELIGIVMPKKVTCRNCGRRTTNDVAKLCDDCLKGQGQMTFNEGEGDVQKHSHS